MKQTIIGFLILLLAGAGSAHALNYDGAMTAAEDLEQTLKLVQRNAKRASNRARYNGKQTRANKFARLANTAGKVKEKLVSKVINRLRRDAPPRRIRRGVTSLEGSMASLNTSADAVKRKPRPLRNGLGNANDQFDELMRVVFSDDDHEPVPPPPPPRLEVEATCNVVLETFFGTNIQKIPGIGIAENNDQFAAKNMAMNNAYRSCRKIIRRNYGDSPMFKCTKDYASCSIKRL